MELDLIATENALIAANLRKAMKAAQARPNDVTMCGVLLAKGDVDGHEFHGNQYGGGGSGGTEDKAKGQQAKDFHANRRDAYSKQAQMSSGNQAKAFRDAAQAHDMARNAVGTDQYNLLAVGASNAGERATTHSATGIPHEGAAGAKPGDVKVGDTVTYHKPENETEQKFRGVVMQHNDAKSGAFPPRTSVRWSNSGMSIAPIMTHESSAFVRAKK